MNIIETRDLSKMYLLNSRRAATSLRDLLSAGFSRRKDSRSEEREVWALKDVSFSVGAGESVALVGNNGAGKSTLLKILSRIVRPTSGEAVLHGRTGSLLEVGTGFHRELSGRENVYLNGAVLGMRRSEIKERFDEIVAFAEVEKFIDTPIKFYSTGMYMRLAFAVAAHLDTEILIVDEVLAVGDTAFQKKCLNKMQDIGKQGRTVIFVSHNMRAVTRLCSRAIWLENGSLRDDSSSTEIVSAYMNSQTKTTGERRWETFAEAPGDEHARLWSVAVCQDGSGSAFEKDKPVTIRIEWEILDRDRRIVPLIKLYNEDNLCVFTSEEDHMGHPDENRGAAKYSSEVTIPANLLADGSYFLTVSAHTTEPRREHFQERDVVSFLVANRYEEGEPGSGAGHEGIVQPSIEWKTVPSRVS